MDEELKPIIVNLAEARGIAAVRLIAVGVFLSSLLIPSRQLVNYMRNVWRVRGSMEMHQIADKRFVLEFSEEGDFEHVTKGGPWRYQKDAILVQELKEGEDPEEVLFEMLPIWAQFKGIPFYLLSKELARNMADHLGKRICINNNARGDIQDKILRARVLIHIARPLQRWITLMDSHTNEEVTVNVLYERLPNFCLVCGVIGHREDGCDLPASLRRRRYNTGLGVQHTHVDDPRKWYLAESAGENRALWLNAPWRNIPRLRANTSLTPTQQAASVALVAEKVGKMTVQDNEKKGEIATPADMNISDNRTINLHDKNATPAATTIATNNKSLVPDSSAPPVAVNHSNKSCSDTAKSSESSNNKGLK
jgi:hypothetical protein